MLRHASLRVLVASILAAVAPLSASGCGGGNGAGTPSGDDTGLADASDGSTPDGGDDTGFVFDTGGDGQSCDPPCSPGSFCYANTCVQQQPPCTKDDDCQNDTYCDTASQQCLPYGVGGKVNNPDCVAFVPVGVFAPEVHCEFTQSPSGDAFPTYLNVLATVAVAPFGPGETPAIVAPFYNGTDGSSEQNGILRILSGKDCSQIADLGGAAASPTYVSASSTVAIGDLDGDGKPEIVAYSKPGGGRSVTAFKRDAAGIWNVFWEATNADGTPWRLGGTPTEWAGPSIHDLDDDGKPEILREAYVFDASGKLLASPPAGFSSGYGTGQFPVVADIDGDGSVEMVNGQGIWRFDKTTKQWTAVAASTSGFAGLTALADFGTASVDGVFDGKAEIAVVKSGQVIVENAAGAVVWGPIALPGSAGGGPPTIADFDGDGQPEIAVAGSDSYNVIDPDCQATSMRPGGKCATGATNGVLWSKKSQDHSSNITGSSVFDFDADGVAEAIYADECFARIYSGDTGDVIFSQYMSSCTWYENPVVADVNLDDRAELIVGSNLNCPDPGTPANSGRPCAAGEVAFPDPTRPSVAVDAVFPGLRCKQAGDCVSGVCDSGFCRCTADAQCCTDKDAAKCMEVGFICMPPPAGTPGTGNTCRAAHPHGRAGIRIYKDFADRWVRSRSIWNQHAYSITNVNDDGTIPKTSAWVANWKHTGPRYNDFRKNTPGTQDPLKAPDLTAKGSQQTCSMGKLTLSVEVCNRGAAKAADNYTVTFQQGDATTPGPVICTAATTMPLDVGQCQTLSCDWTNPPASSADAKDVTIVVDAEGHVRQCNKDNKKSFLKGVYCGTT